VHSGGRREGLGLSGVKDQTHLRGVWASAAPALTLAQQASACHADIYNSPGKRKLSAGKL